MTTLASPNDYIDEGGMELSRHTRLEHTAQCVEHMAMGYRAWVRFLAETEMLFLLKLKWILEQLSVHSRDKPTEG